ncbi:flagellar brake protein [Denitratisoma sp. agr-D3]
MILTEENLDEYTITFRREILFYMRQLINEAAQTSIVFDGGKNTMLTVLLDIDEEENLVIFDWGGSEEANALLLNSPKNYFISRPQGVRNQFATGPVREISYNGRRAFAADLPEKYIRLQRREFFRLSLPLTMRPLCTLTTADGQSMELEAVDIGIGGIGLEAPELTIPCELGTVFPDSRIDIKDQGVLQVDIKVCYMGEVTRGVRQAIRLGCNFENITAAQETELQLLITHVQREERARMGR